MSEPRTPAANPRRATAVYVHFPWCKRKCPYCDFASLAAEPGRIPARRYTDALLRELELRAPWLAGRSLQSVFVGGGTPSLWAPAELGRLLDGLRAAFEAHEAPLEVTVECNPRSLTEARAAAFAEVGVERLSVGVQSLRDEGLRWLGRLHDARGALSAVRAAARHVPRVSADLIFGWPGLRPEALVQDAERLLEAGARHLSVYALTIEPDTRFGELHRRGRLRVADEAGYAKQYAALCERVAALGLTHYEVSNWALPGQQARHNQHVWRGGEYLGLGAGAVGALALQDGRARRHRNHPLPGRYMRAVETCGGLAGVPDGSRDGVHPWEAEREWLDPGTRVREAWMLGLRTAEGVDLARVRRTTGVDPLQGRREAVERLRRAGRLQIEADRVRVPESYWFVLDGIVLELF